MFYRIFFMIAFGAAAVGSSCQQKTAGNPSTNGGAVTSPFNVTFTRIAGDSTQFGSADNADPLKARFLFPKKLVWDHRTQTLLIADGSGAGRIRKMDKSGNITTPLPYTGTSNDIHDACLAPDKAGTVYFGTTLGQLEKYSDGGTPEIIINWKQKNGTHKNGNETGSLDAAAISGPNGITAAPNGDVYVANDYYKTIHKIDFRVAGNEVSEFAGRPTAGVSASAFDFADGQGNAATFGKISDMAIDDNGTLYVADDGYCTVRKITPSGTVSSFFKPSPRTYMYYPNRDGALADARASKVSHVAVSRDGSLVFFSTAISLRLIRPGKDVTTLAYLGGINGLTCTPDGKTLYATSGHAVYKISLQ